ncbi:MAG: hypothetical protein IKS83_06525 [Victivallales bacterium]|nr:hypothetical protein [Victivallales bacterium]
MKKILAFAVLLVTAFFLGAQELTPVQLEMPTPPPVDETLPQSPLTVNGSQEPEIDLGRVFKLANRFFRVTIVNPSDEVIKYTNIVVNCECTTIENKIKVPGEIPAHGKLDLLMRLNAGDMHSKVFFRMIRFELEKYRQFQINFTGELDTSLYMTYYDEPEQVKHGDIMVGYVEDPTEPWMTRLNITLDSEDETLELAKVKCTRNFIAALHRYDERHWQVELRGAVPMSLGEFKDVVVVELTSPRPADPAQKDIIILPVKGICGTRIMSSASEVYVDPKTAPEYVEQTIMLERVPFLDKISLARVFSGHTNPYVPKIRMLDADEIQLPTDVPGVEFEVIQRERGVAVKLKMRRDELVEDGYPALFQVKNSAPAQVWIGLLSEERREQFAEEAAAKAAAEAAEAEAQAEQDAIE